MKKLIAITLTLIMCVGLVGCGGSTEDSVESKVADAVESRVMTEVMLRYDTKGSPTITTFVDDQGGNNYVVTGKVTVMDKYGDSYTGKYDATAKYDPETEDCDVDVTIDTLYKD